MKATIYIHPTCKSSYRLIKHLYTKQLLNKIQFIDTSATPLGAPWSVPWVQLDGQPAATDPVNPEEVETILQGKLPEGPSKPIEAFMESILYSAHASAQVLVHGSLDPVIDEKFAMAVLRRPGDRQAATHLLSEIMEREEELYRDWQGKIARALSLSFVRELAWVHGGKISPDELASRADPTTIGLWIIGKASTGRAGLPWKPVLPETAEEMSRFLARGAKRLAKKLNDEIETIYGDAEYWDILKSIL